MLLVSCMCLNIVNKWNTTSLGEINANWLSEQTVSNISTCSFFDFSVGWLLFCLMLFCDNSVQKPVNDHPWNEVEDHGHTTWFPVASSNWNPAWWIIWCSCELAGTGITVSKSLNTVRGVLLRCTLSQVHKSQLWFEKDRVFRNIEILSTFLCGTIQNCSQWLWCCLDPSGISNQITVASK